MKKPRIVVIGAGAFGSWTAYFLQRAGARVVLLDAWGAGNTRASSGGESRIIRSVYGPDRIYTQMVKEAFSHWGAFEKRWNKTCYRRTGALWLFSGGEVAYMHRSLPHLEEAGLTVEEWDLAELSRRYPQVGSEGVEHVFFEPEAGLLYARRIGTYLAEAFMALGGDYHRWKAVAGPIEKGQMPCVRLSDGSKLQADTFVFACGPWLPQLFPELVGEVLTVTRQEVYFFGLPAGDQAHRFPDLPVWIDFGPEIYYGLPVENLRGFKVADDIRTQPFDPDRGDRLPTAERLAAARRYLERRFHAFRNAPLQESRVCQYLNSPDGHLVIDRHPEANNVWIAGAGTGHAFKLGPAIGALLSDQILSGAPARPPFSLDRLRNLESKDFTQFRVD